ncbi:glycosyltransferase family 2 protein [Roseateles violae]|uniref:Glycosyltransferase family A protein n=1 Tax=Roseateles violae TaxID=3058042 RepID=A0ABT8DVQ8_9BURK|nr:glycosyltransferase family A protein [Pelomonas sp. PFR6]MDN3922347.1 glycosyltransferase family A protein [Pelomonas sp. PFR6]
MSAAPPAAVQISVVVPTFRRPALLQRCLDALRQQRLDEAFEVLVVDDGHCDKTREQVEALARHWPGLRYLRPLDARPGSGPAQARNWGWRVARAELIAFTDDDTVPDPGWLAAGLAALRARPELMALAGKVRVPLPPRRPSDHERMTAGLQRASFVTANAFVRRSALEAVGGFDERFRRAWREDSDLQFRLERRFGPIPRCCGAVVLHPVRPERWGVSLRQQRNVFFDALLYRKHARRYRAELRPRPPWDYYAIVLLAPAALVLALAGRAQAAAIAALLAALLVLALAARRLRGSALTPAHLLEMLATSALIPFLSVYWRLRGALHFRVWFV